MSKLNINLKYEKILPIILESTRDFVIDEKYQIMFLEIDSPTVRELLTCILTEENFEKTYWRLQALVRFFVVYFIELRRNPRKGVKKNDITEMTLFNEATDLFRMIHHARIPFHLWEDLAKEFVEFMKLMLKKKNFYYYNYPEYDLLKEKIRARELQLCKEYLNVFDNQYGFI